MRHLIVCDGTTEATIIGEATRNLGPSADRLIILSARRGSAWESGVILSIPLRWGLKNSASLHWSKQDRVKKAITLLAGLRSARWFGSLEDLLMQIDACDPDVIDLRKLGAFGEWLKPKCGLRFPGRTVIAPSDNYPLDESVASWRTYDRTALVSIVLPTYNSEKYLSLAIESCLKQTHKNFELIIVDDNSVDDTPVIIRKYAAQDPRIRYIARREPTPGLPESLNAGFNMAQGSFLTWFQSDNLYTPTAIAYMVQQLCTFTKIGLVYCSTFHISESGNPTPPVYFSPAFPPTALARWTAISGSFMYRREVMEIVGAYRPECRYFEDLDFFIRACTRVPAKFCLEPCHVYRRHNGSLTAAYSDQGRNWKLWSRQMHLEHFASGRTRIIMPTVEQLTPDSFLANT